MSGASAEDTTGASSGASGGSNDGINVPNYADLLSKMEYGDNTADTNKLNAIIAADPSLFELPADAIDKYALNCSISAPVNFLYLSTIRGGRKMNSVGSEENRAIDTNGMSVGGGCGCGIKGGGNGNNNYSGGCFTCKKGTKNITLIYSGIHIIIPKLYTKYRTASAAKATKAKAIKKAKTA